jgi:hypothetical protein
LDNDESDGRGREALRGETRGAGLRIRSLGIMVRDGAAVLAAIMIAFGLDAWWADRGEAERTDQLLLAMAGEFEAATVQIDSIVRVNDRVVATSIAFLARTEPGLPPLSRDSVAQYSALLTMEMYEPAFGALNTLISSGGLERVRDLGLQQALGGWQGELEDHDFEVQQIALTLQRGLEAMSAAGVTSALVLERAVGSQGNPEIWVQLGASDGFRQTLAEMTFLLTDYRRDLVRTRDRASQLAKRLGG